ncbi:site-specific integrase, partial [Thermoflexus sp.]|uniref:site-specific integrase n=1 Tax=Thermoflexus sp. TaxID=1969742 RepID=UPI00260EDD80
MTRQARLPLDLPPDLAPVEARSEPGLSLGEAIEAFLRAGRGRGDRSYSQRTLREYRLRLLRFAAAVGPERSLRSIAVEDLRRFVADLSRRESDYRLHDHLVTLKSFFGWALREGLVEEDPSARFMLPAAPERAIVVLSPQGLERLREILRKRPDPQLRAFAELSFCGLRR